MDVKAAVARTRASALTLEGLRLDEPRADEILVRLVAAGVTRFDLDAIDGMTAMALPFVPGAEAAGIVERVGEAVTHVAPGNAVVTSFASCGQCAACRSGHRRACVAFAQLNLSGRRLDGSSPFVGQAEGQISDQVGGFFFGQSAFATHMLCHASCAVKVPATAPLEIFACAGGDILCGAGTVSRGFHLSQGDSLAVVGADALGLAAVMMAKALEAEPIIVADPNERHRKLAEDCGATVTVHTHDALADAARGLTGEGVRFALDTTGDPGAEKACRDSVWRGGICAFKRAGADKPSDDGPSTIATEEHGPPATLISKLVGLYEHGRFPLDRIINFFAFEHVNDALEALRKADVVKPVLRFPLGGFGDLDRAKEEGAVSEPDEPQEPETEEDKQRASAGAPVTS